MYAFREGRRVSPSLLVIGQVQDAVRSLDGRGEPGRIAALLQAGAAECGLSDEASPAAALAAELTDCIAAGFFGPSPRDPAPLAALLARRRLPDTLALTTPEGFAYYDLDPLAFAQTALREFGSAERVAILGIRSIGTTLSAIVRTALQSKNVLASRRTVRPGGHPFDRSLALEQETQRWIEKEAKSGARFIVVDEGPGLSGSSFLAAGEALVRCGVDSARITFLCSRVPDFAVLCAPNAAARSSQFRWQDVSDQDERPPQTAADLSAGAWRRQFFRDQAEFWPATWTQLERKKFLSRDAKWLWKFEGLGPYGDENHQHAILLAKLGSGPAPAERWRGFIRYPVVNGRHCSDETVSEAMLEQFARYCALRRDSFQAGPGVRNVERVDLSTMVRVNLTEALGLDDIPLDLGYLHPANWRHTVVCDGRMQPHEWLVMPNGRMLKTDGTNHGDDHFFPGPTDIAWDLAGVIVEWKLENAAADYFLKRYKRLSGDDPVLRLPAFLLAYTAFRLGYCTTAASALRGSDEEARLRASASRYLQQVRAILVGQTLQQAA